jgi:hypothetical protein
MTLIFPPANVGPAVAVPSVTSNSVWPWVEPMPALAGRAPDGRRWPRISVVTPNYNYADLIETTLRSVLVQDYPELEYLVMDDGSTDASLDVIRRYGGQLAHWGTHANMGQYATINRGFAKATGDIFGWINSDDAYLPWTLRTVGQIFAQFPEVQWVVGLPARLQDGVIHAVSKLIPYPRELVRAGLFHGGAGGLGWIQQESCFWRRGLWEKAGGLRPEFRYAADFELWTRFAEHADLYAVTTVLGGFTVRGNQNRSIANREKYMNEVYAAQQEIAARAVTDGELARLLADLARYDRVKHLRGLRGVAKRVLQLRQYRGPLLRWNFDEGRYKVESLPYFH